MAQARSNPMYAQEDADDVAPPTPAFSTGVQPAVAFRSDLTPHSERRGGAGGGTAGGGTRFAYWDQGGDPHGFGNDSQVSLLLCVMFETWDECILATRKVGVRCLMYNGHENTHYIQRILMYSYVHTTS